VRRPYLPEVLGRTPGRANPMVDQKHQPKWHVLDEQRRNARAVRRKMTAERIVCDNAPAHRIQGVSLPRHTPVGRYLVGFVCHAAKLIVELDGGQHFEPTTLVRHARRDACLTVQGCGVVGFNNLDVVKNEAGVLEAAVALGGSPSPSLTLPKPGRGRGPAGREDAP
jgi:very-short-patch-repair endonuclease